MELTLTTSTITALQKIITGDPVGNDQALAPYMTWNDLSNFFGAFPGLDTSEATRDSRWKYVEAVLRQVNGTESVRRIIEAAVSPGRFLNSEVEVEDAVEYLNDYLVYEGLRLVRHGLRFRLVEADDVGNTQVAQVLEHLDPLAYETIEAHHKKALQRIEAQDFDGAITLARTMLESVLIELDHRLPGGTIDYKGKLSRLFKSVQTKLRLDPSNQDVQSLQEILQGLASIANGLGNLRNNMGDAHPTKYRPHRHHAVLALNAAMTLVMFLFETEQYQAAMQSSLEANESSTPGGLSQQN